MTFHIPIDSELVSTDVAYQVAEYDENATYSDGEEVRKGDDIYQVFNYSDTTPYPDYIDYYPYAWKDKVNINGVGYEKYDIVTGVGCWQIVDALSVTNSKLGADVDATDIDMAIFNTWDGVADGVWHQFSVQGGNCSSINGNDYFKFTTLSVYDDHYTVQVMQNDTDSDTDATLAGNIEMYPDNKIIARPNPYFIKGEDGYIKKVFGFTSDFIAEEGIKKGLWKKLDKNYDEINKHKLEFLRKSVKSVPFDTKQFTSVSVVGKQNWTVKSGSRITSLILGSIKSSSITIQRLDISDTVHDIITITPKILILDGKNQEPTTEIIYFNDDLITRSVIITISAQTQVAVSQVGTIMLCNYLDIGATDLSFSHNVKNYDKNQVSQTSGYVDHIKGNRVIQHKGSFYINITDYDKTVMINKRFTQELIAIDSSDNVDNEESDSERVFSSTRIIGRLKQMSLKTDVKDNIINKNVRVSFEFEEIV